MVKKSRENTKLLISLGGATAVAKVSTKWSDNNDVQKEMRKLAKLFVAEMKHWWLGLMQSTREGNETSKREMSLKSFEVQKVRSVSHSHRTSSKTPGGRSADSVLLGGLTDGLVILDCRWPKVRRVKH
jgi:hypothetical protein